MKFFTSTAAGALVSLAIGSMAFAQQESGVVGSGAPEDVVLEITVADGSVTLSQSEFRLAHGGYYRFNLVCPDGLENEVGLNFKAPELFENAHSRILSVSNPETDAEINFHIQGLNFRQIDCEGVAGSARFSFHPMRKGTFPFIVAMDGTDQEREVTGEFIVE